MTQQPTYPQWLPPDRSYIGYELARVDELAWKLFECAIEFSRIDIVKLVERREGDETVVVVDALADVPPIIPLLFGEAINHLRAAIEHSVVASVEIAAGSPLAAHVLKKVSFPICTAPAGFSEWSSRVRKIPGLAASDPLYQRIELMQPFVDVHTAVANQKALFGPAALDHPLVLLQAYSNVDKHHRVHSAVTRDVGLDLGPGPGGMPAVFAPPGPYELGRVIHRGPADQPGFIDLRPAVMVERPTPNGGWAPPAREIHQLHRHVAEVVIPSLWTGARASGIHPQVDLGSVNIGDTRSVGDIYAFDRTNDVIAARLAETRDEVRYLRAPRAGA